MGHPASASVGAAGARRPQSRPQAAAPDTAGLRPLCGLLLRLLRLVVRDGLDRRSRLRGIRLLLGFGPRLTVLAEPELGVDLGLQLRGQLRVVAQELLRVVAALAEPGLAVREERTGL